MMLPRHPPARRLACYDYRTVLAAVAEHSGIAADSFLRQRSGAVSRDLAAWLARELTPVRLRELSAAFGLTHPDSVRNLIRRADRPSLAPVCSMTRSRLSATASQKPALTPRSPRVRLLRPEEVQRLELGEGSELVQTGVRHLRPEVQRQWEM